MIRHEFETKNPPITRFKVTLSPNVVMFRTLKTILCADDVECCWFDNPIKQSAPRLSTRRLRLELGHETQASIKLKYDSLAMSCLRRFGHALT